MCKYEILIKNRRQGAEWEGGFQRNGARGMGKLDKLSLSTLVISVTSHGWKKGCLLIFFFFFEKGKARASGINIQCSSVQLRGKTCILEIFLWDLGFNFPLFTVFICLCLARNRAFEVSLTKLICLKFDSSRFPSSYEFGLSKGLGLNAWEGNTLTEILNYMLCILIIYHALKNELGNGCWGKKPYSCTAKKVVGISVWLPSPPLNIYLSKVSHSPTLPIKGRL